MLFRNFLMRFLFSTLFCVFIQANAMLSTQQKQELENFAQALLKKNNYEVNPRIKGIIENVSSYVETTLPEAIESLKSQSEMSVENIIKTYVDGLLEKSTLKEKDKKHCRRLVREEFEKIRNSLEKIQKPSNNSIKKFHEKSKLAFDMPFYLVKALLFVCIFCLCTTTAMSQPPLYPECRDSDNSFACNHLKNLQAQSERIKKYEEAEFAKRLEAHNAHGSANIPYMSHGTLYKSNSNPFDTQSWQSAPTAPFNHPNGMVGDVYPYAYNRRR